MGLHTIGEREKLQRSGLLKSLNKQKIHNLKKGNKGRVVESESRVATIYDLEGALFNKTTKNCNKEIAKCDPYSGKETVNRNCL